jgi:hypothetical protein
MSHNLGDPALDYVILGEGNTSARADADTFWVKASGTELRTIDATGFVRVSFERVLAMLSDPTLDDEAVEQGLYAAKVDSPPGEGVRPSVETVLHALCLSLEGVARWPLRQPSAAGSSPTKSSFAVQRQWWYLTPTQAFPWPA